MAKKRFDDMTPEERKKFFDEGYRRLHAKDNGLDPERLGENDTDEFLARFDHAGAGTENDDHMDFT